MNELPLKLALKGACRAAHTFLAGHSWSDEISPVFWPALKAIEERNYKFVDVESLPPELIPELRRARDFARPYSRDVDLYGYEARSVIWRVDFIDEWLAAQENEEAKGGT